MSLGCKICDDKAVCRVVDEELERGLTYTAIARMMTLRGFKVTAVTIGRHNRHRTPTVLPEIARKKRDFAIMVRERAADMLEAGQLDLADKDKVPGINAGLKAQAIIDKKEVQRQKQSAADVLIALLGALRGEPPLQLESGDVIDGTAVEIE
jgi:hypothetical protein